MYIITGMHRSGTSLVAQLFCEAGADMGNPSTFHRPDRWNPDGYFEQQEILAVNQPLIHGPWGRLAYFRLPSSHAILRRAARRRDQIRTIAEKYRDKVVKETRFCLTLPAWFACGASVEKILVCLRHPVQVVRSIRSRNRISLRHAYRLWQVHLERLLDSVGNVPVWFVCYSKLLDQNQSAGEISRAFDFFGLDVSPTQLDSLRRRVVKPNMNHWRDVKPELPREVDVFWRNLTDRYAQQREYRPVDSTETPGP